MRCRQKPILYLDTHIKISGRVCYPVARGQPLYQLRLIDSCITQLKAQGPSRTCDESKEEEEEWGDTPWMCGRVGTDLGGVVVLALRAVLALAGPHVEPAVRGAGPLPSGEPTLQQSTIT